MLIINRKIAEVAVTDGFEYSVDDILYTERSNSTDATLGTTREFTVVISNENGIRTINFSITNATTDQNLIAAINTGRYKVADYLSSADYANEMPAVSHASENN